MLLAFEPNEHNQLKITTNSHDPLYLLVPAKYLFKVIKGVRSDYLRFVLTENESLEIWDDDSVFSLQALDAGNLSAFNLHDIEPSFSLTMLELSAVVREVCFAASQKDPREYLKGVHFEFRKDGLYCEATDTLCFSRKVFHKSGPISVGVTIPVPVLKHTQKIFKFHKQIDFAFEGKFVQIKDGSCIYEAEAYDEEYPDLDHIIPDRKKVTSTLIVKPQEMKEALNQCVLLSEPYLTTKVDLSCSKDKVSLISSQRNVGYSDQNISEFSYEGEPLKICFDTKIMLRILMALSSGKDIMQIDLISRIKPMIITKPDDPDLLMLMVPLRSR